LKHIFSPKEAEIATCLTYKLEPLETVLERVGHLVESPEKLTEILDGIEKKGGIELEIRDGERFYRNVPLVVGMYELQLGELTQEFIKDFDDYTSDKRFGIEFLSTKIPQMRTIPISRSIQPQHHTSTFDEVTTLLQQAEAPFRIDEASARLANYFCLWRPPVPTCKPSYSLPRLIGVNPKERGGHHEKQHNENINNRGCCDLFRRWRFFCR